MNRLFQSWLFVLTCCFCYPSEGSGFIPEQIQPNVIYASEHPVNDLWITPEIQKNGGCLLKNGDTKTWKDFLKIKQDKEDAQNIVDLVFPQNFGEEIPEKFCEKMTNLQHVQIPLSIKTIRGGAFHVCSVLSKISGGQNVTKIDGNAFQGCFLLENFPFFPSLKNIGRFAFGSTGLEAITIPNSIEEIAGSAFHSSRQLKIVHLPVSIEKIGTAFLSCTSLDKVIVTGDEHQESYYEFLKKLCSTFIGCPLGKNDLEHPTILYVTHLEVCRQDLNRLNEELRQQNKPILNVKVEPKNEQTENFFLDYPVLATTLTMGAGVAAFVGMKIFGKKKG